jgi:catechol 2,3-dioxygenase-like lactoylglutathione lyase family enzyme
MTFLAGRFLHVNLNCESLATTESFYVDGLGLSARMRTDPETPTNGAILGLDGETYCTTSFLYDARGGRRSCAVEAIEFRSPTIRHDDSLDPVRPGIRSTLFTVADLEATAARLQADGAAVSQPVGGLSSGRRSVLITDPDGGIVELSEASPGADTSTGALFSGIRIAAIDAAATGEFLRAIGFDELEAPSRIPVTGEQLAPGGGTSPTECLVGRYALPEDADRFTVTVVEHPSTSGPPVPWGGNHQGLYRCALRVENVDDALAHVPEFVEVKGEPVWCPLPGTKIDGLRIAFLRSPDGVVFEFVERPLRFFGDK